MYKQFFKQQWVIYPLLFICFLLSGFAKAQQQYNLINNYSYEQYPICPTAAKPQLPDYWNDASNIRTIYCNTCVKSSIALSVPKNYAGNWLNYQWPRTGNGYCVFAVHYSDQFNSRDYVQTQFKVPLVANKKYMVEFYVVLADSCRGGTNNVAAWINVDAKYRDTTSTATRRKVLLGNPQVYNFGNPFITDTMNWVRVSSIYKAQGGEKHIIIGSFVDDAHTDTFIVNYTSPSETIAYQVDDVSVIPLDSFNLQADAGRDTIITIGDSVFIGSYTNGIDTIKWQNQNTGLIIDSVQPGFWVKPLINTCYVVTQTVNGYTSSDTVCVTVKPLPLTMINYKLLMINEKQVENKWETANEVNVSHYNIQRSTNGRDFITIGTVKAKNRSSNEYSFNDPLTSNEKQETFFFRIVGVDRDGAKQYSEIKTLNFKPKTSNVQVYPNPAKDVVNIVGSNITKVTINTIEGKQVITSSAKQIDVSKLAKGIYIVNVYTTTGNVVNEKLFIQ